MIYLKKEVNINRIWYSTAMRQRLLKSRKTVAVPIIIFIIMVIGLVLPVAGYCFGLEVNPEEIVVQGCPLGKQVAVSELGGEKMKLKIENKGAAAYTYTISALSSSQATSQLKKDYIDIPDTSWIIAENKEVSIPGNSIKEVELYLKIPKSKKYFNKRYQAIIEVKSKKNKPEDIFVLAVQLRLCFSTLEKKVAK
jgi:hypothetical protein